MIIIYSHVVSNCLIKVTVGAGEDDVTGLKNSFYLFGSCGTFESKCVMVCWRGRGQQFDYFLHNGDLSRLHVDS